MTTHRDETINESIDGRPPFQMWVDLAKHHKQMWLEIMQTGDMNPTVVGLRDGKPQLLVIAPQLDKHQGLQAINIMRKGMGIDEVMMITDGHTILTEGKSEEECKRLYEKYVGKPGSMQAACDEEGACDLGEIADTLCVHYLDKDERFSMASYPYFYHGKDDDGKEYVPFKWLETDIQEMMRSKVDMELEERAASAKSQEELADQIPEEDKKEPMVGGLVPTSMVQIMRQPSMCDDENVKQVAASLGLDINSEEGREKALFHTGVVIRRLLDEQGFLCMECLSYNGSYEDFVEQMAEKYKACKRAYDQKMDFDLQTLEMELQKAEEQAKAENNQEMLLQIRHVRAELEKRKEEMKKDDSTEEVHEGSTS